MIQVVLQQVIILSCMMLLGFILGKKKYLNQEGSGLLTKLLLDVFFPCSVVASVSSIGEGSLMQTMGVILFYFALLIVFTLIAYAIAKLLKMGEDDMLVFTRSVGYPNNGFMGLPLCSTIFGSQGTAWAALSVPGTTVYMFAFLMLRFQREKETKGSSRLKSMINPMNISVVLMLVMIATGWRMPSILQQLCSSFGSCVTPVAMLIIGYLLSNNPLLDALRRPILYVVTLLRNIICPLLGACLLRFTPWNREMCLCLVIVMGCSVASSVSIFANQYGRSPEFASQSMLQSSLLLPATMPLVALIAEKILIM